MLLPVVRQPRVEAPATRPGPGRRSNRAGSSTRRLSACSGAADRRTPADRSELRALDRPARELLREVAVRARLGCVPMRPPASISLARLDAGSLADSRRDAATGGPDAPAPNCSRSRFGDEHDDSSGPADLGSVAPRRDRPDRRRPDGRALIRDYKPSAKVPRPRTSPSRASCSSPLHARRPRAARARPDRRPLQPARRPRRTIGRARQGTEGGADPDDKDTLRDRTSSTPSRSRRCSRRLAAKPAGSRCDPGRTNRSRPHDGVCPAWCTLAPICRIERAIPLLDDEDEDEAAA